MTGTAVTLHGLTYLPVTDIRTLAPGMYLRQTHDSHATDFLTVPQPYGTHENREGVLCRRQGRDASGTWQTVLTPAALQYSRVLRAAEIPAHGIPGTWCDGYDTAGDPCGRSLLHQGDCRN